MSETKPKTGKGKLPPIDPNATADDADKPKKKVVKKKKKPVEETAAEGVEPPKRTPRKKKAASADSTAGEGAETTAPKKKKRVPKKTDKEGDPSSARSATSQGEDVNGSKASLIKSPKDGTPRKKKTKKKDKKAERGETEAGFDNTLTAELTDLQDDIIPHDAKRDEEEEEEYKKPYATGSHAVRSQPTEKFYIETDGGFKGENKNRFAKRQLEEAKEKAIVHEEPKNTTMEFALTTQKVIRTFSLFCHGLLAGLSVWHIVMAYVLLDFPLQDFILHYGKLALPVQCIFFILLLICTVSALDRFDVANPRGGFVLKALTLQNGTVSVVFYFAALLVSLSNAALEDKIHLYDQQLRNLTVNEELLTLGDDEVQLWRNLNTSRNVLSVIGWFVISLTPLTDRLTDNLKHTDEDDLLGVEVETNKSAIA
ncbi:transmembrane protein 237-like [Mya arenaria]|uniref:transmembrane protein 237-like n=1 Tax=Mya arenaria TaxID=6604 RepID=UPI0022E25C0C|nr:transmembrane protein 237-like [Mya arenaria]